MAAPIKQGVLGSATPTRGVSIDQTLGYGGTTTVLVRDVGSKVLYLDPSAAPFTLLTDRAGSQKASNPTFEWYDKTLRPKVSAAAAAYSDLTTTTEVTVTTGTRNYFQVNDLVLNPSSGEIMRVLDSSTTTNVINVTRNINGTHAAGVTSDDLFVIGSAWNEGADVGIPDEWQEVHHTNKTQIFRRPFGASRTREASETFFGQTRPRLRAEKAIEHAMDMEKAFLFNTASAEAGTTNSLYRVTQGLLGFTTSNVTDLGGATLTEPDMESWFEGLFMHTGAGSSRVLFASPRVVSAFDMLGVNKVQTVQSDKTYGLSIKQYLTSHGTINIIKHPLLVNNSGVTANTEFAAGYGSYGIAIDPGKLKMRPLSGGTTKLLTDRQGPGVDGWIDEYLTEAGFQLSNPEVFGVIKNVGAAA